MMKPTPDGYCWCIVKNGTRRCLNKAPPGELNCFLDTHFCRGDEKEESMMKDEEMSPKVEQYLSAAYEGDWKTMKECLKKHPSVKNGRGVTFWYAVEYAIAGGHNNIVEKLVKSNNQCLSVADMCLFAAKHGNVEVLSSIIDEKTAYKAVLDTEATDIAGLVSLSALIAVIEGHLNILTFLMIDKARSEVIRKARSEVIRKARYGDDNRTILMIAVQARHFDMVELILGSDQMEIHAKDKFGFTALALIDFDSDLDNLKMAKLLVVKGGAKLTDRTDGSGGIVFFDIINNIGMDREMLEWMLEEGGMDPNFTGALGSNALTRLIVGRDFEMVKWFVETYKPYTGKSDRAYPLAEALSKQHAVNDFEVARWLIKKKYVQVDEVLRESYPTGQTALLYLASDNPVRKDVIKNLVEIAKCDIDVKDDAEQSIWTLLLPYWVPKKDTERYSRRDIGDGILRALLARMQPPENVLKDLLASKHKDLVTRGIRLQEKLTLHKEKRRVAVVETRSRLPKALHNLIFEMDGNLSTTNEVWATGLGDEPELEPEPEPEPLPRMRREVWM
jgi:ankyrin repeat protein